ncbi:MAG: ribosomal protein S18-alanine N-acetyltransferase [Pseudochelatococcus sp.]|jgi:ribosomal-protein-alanine N-acetyltransferase|uniref:ribosomal protein S18-alanine N-acetyltransferase n=1 Tax=Pseudochelatococcus sp. TaxID=2020869 RepID=UPI003D8F6CF1
MLRDLFTFHRPPPRIAPLTGDHAEAAAAIHAASFARAWEATELERMLAGKAHVADGAFAGGTSERQAPLIGFLLSRIVIDEAEILTVAVAPDARGTGAGRLLLTHHLDRLQRFGVRAVFLEVEEGNAPALALYRRAGFTEIGRRPGYYPAPDGSRAAALTMRAQLD